MKEAQSLKVRHYLALGIPVLLAGGESKEVLESNFVYQLPDTSAQHIADGLKKLAVQTFSREKIMRYANAHLSWEAIASKTFKFLQTIKI